MNTLIKASGCSVEGYWPVLFSKMAGKVDLASLMSIGSGGGGGGVVGGTASVGVVAAAGDATDSKKETKTEVEEEEDEGMDFDLFG
mmetsp:Transcript_55235/g.85894  ORF Transcript_55235/g.85894 Transcript_55235/m.85894 type:complete len:86 (-) Transcript_55235:56-313(-)